MRQYAARRIIQLFPVLFLTSIGIFLIIHLIPGDPARNIGGPNATEIQLATLRHQFGLDLPLPVQYVIWLRRALSGDLGFSYLNNYPVNQLVLQAVPATIELAMTALIIAILIAFPLGISSAIRPGGLMDMVGTLFSALALAIPSFWLAMLLVFFFSLQLMLLPPSGRPEFIAQPDQHLKSLLMPAFTLGLVVAANLTRYLRAAILDVLHQEYIRTAQSKGLHDRLIIFRHVLSNALIPVITVLGLQVGDLLSGALIVESIFAWPGVGRLTIQAIRWRDYSLLQANVLYIVSAFLLISLITDLVYGLVDPRIRHQ